MAENSNKSFRGEAVRRINKCIQQLNLPLYSSEALKWHIEANEEVTEVTVTVGDRTPEKRQYTHLFAATTELKSLNEALDSQYQTFIWGQPDLKECRNTAEIYAKVAKICGARSDVVQRFTIERDPAYQSMFAIKCYSYTGTSIRQEFSTALVESPYVDGILDSSLSIMIKSLEGLKHAQQTATTQET